MSKTKREIGREYYLRNREKILARNKAYRATPEAKARAADLRQRPKFKVRQRAYMSRWRKTSEAYLKIREKDLRKRRDGRPKIYFIQSESGPVKIGFATKSAVARMSELQVGSYEELNLLKWILGTKEEESALQERFSEARIRGEWYRPVPELMSYIESLSIIT